MLLAKDRRKALCIDVKIRLISPSYNFYAHESIEYRKRKQNIAIFPPLNIALLASLTPKKHHLELVDEYVMVWDVDADVDLVGLGSVPRTAPRMYQLADRYRRLGVKVVLGGSHVTALPEEGLEHADAVVVGEADEIWEKVLADFENGTPQPIYRQDKFSSLKHLNTNRRSLLPQGGYYMPRTVQTSRGCPYNCSFCSVTSTFGSRYRNRPIEDVIEEIKETPGPGLVIFTDDNILADRRRAKELFRALKDLKIIWASQASINNGYNAELLRLAYESGCRGLFVGIESTSPASLKEMKKDKVNKPQDYMRLIENFHCNGIRLLGAFMFGFDTDDVQTFQETVQFAINSKLDLAQFTILIPYPGTAVYEQLKKEGRLLHTNWGNYHHGSVVYQPNRMSPAQLQKGAEWAHNKFYCLNSKMKRLLRYDKYTPIYWILNNIFSNYKMDSSDNSRMAGVIKCMLPLVDGKFRRNDRGSFKGAEVKAEA